MAKRTATKKASASRPGHQLTQDQITKIARMSKTSTKGGARIFIYEDGSCYPENTCHPQDLDVAASLSKRTDVDYIALTIASKVAQHPNMVRMNPGFNFKRARFIRPTPTPAMSPAEFMAQCFPDNYRMIEGIDARGKKVRGLVLIRKAVSA
jgi:hypothetical protein